MTDPLLIEVGEPIKVVKPAPPFKHWIVRGWAGPLHQWVWWKGYGGRGEICSYRSEEQAKRAVDEILKEKHWNPVLVIPIEYKGKGEDE